MQFTNTIQMLTTATKYLILQPMTKPKLLIENKKALTTRKRPEHPWVHRKDTATLFLRWLDSDDELLHSLSVSIGKSRSTTARAILRFAMEELSKKSPSNLLKIVRDFSKEPKKEFKIKNGM